MLEEKMLELAADYRRRASDLRTGPFSGRDADMSEHFANGFADLWDAAARGIEDAVKNYRRFGQ